MNADVHASGVILVEEKDDGIDPSGVKGVGEIGIVGTAAAIANAIYHATRKRCAACRSRSTSRSGSDSISP